jgi:hypothetical protein
MRTPSLIGRLGRVALALALVAGLVPTPALAAGTAGSSSPARSTASSDDARATIEQAESAGECVSGQALVVYHASGAAKGSSGELGVQSETDPLASAGFGASQTWDLSAADAVAESTGAAADGALSVQSEATDSAIASGSDVRVALVERDDMSVADLVASLESLSFVECAAPNYVYETSSLNADDTYASMQWGLSGSGSEVHGSTAGIDYNDAATAASSSESTNVVAVLDTGVDYNNPDLANVMWSDPGDIGLGYNGSHGYNGSNGTYDPMPMASSEHGTHCAGIIAAQSNNSAGVASIAGGGKTQIMALRHSNDADTIVNSATTACYEYLVKAKLAHVNIVAVNCSWGQHTSEYDPVLDYEINQAGKAGILSVFSSGNDSEDAGTDHEVAQLESPYLIDVAASNANGDLAVFSDYDATLVDVAAPGTNILSTVPNGHVTAFDALLSKKGGKADKLSYCTDIASIADNTSSQGETNFSVELAEYDAKTQLIGKTIDDPNHALSYGVASTTIEGEKSLQVGIDYGKLPSGCDSTNVVALVSWTIDNPFRKLGTFTASDYATSVTPQGNYADGNELDRAYERLLTSDGTDLLAGGSHASTPSHVTNLRDNTSIWDAHLVSTSDVARKDATLTAQVGVQFDTQAQDASGEAVRLTGTHTCLITDFAIGKATDATESDSAFVPYAYESGTSMATPMVAGSVGELAAIYPNYSTLQLRGLVCGGTVALNDPAEQAEIASGGRFTFEKALDDSKVNANTWSITTSGDEVTVHGYNLQKASLYVDGSTTAVTPTAQTAGEISFVAPSLLDGKTHRFDVTDTSTKRTYKAAYVTPDASKSTLVRVHDLPTAVDADSSTVLSSSDRMFCADGSGTYLYSCVDPSDATSPWIELKAPGAPWAGDGTNNRSGIRYAYANGKVYAFATDDVAATSTAAEQIVVYCSVYDIMKNAWTAWDKIGSLDSATVDTLSAAACDGKACCLLYTATFVDGQAVEANTLFSCSAGGTDFTQAKLSKTLFKKLVGVGDTLYGTTFDSTSEGSNDYCIGLASVDSSTAETMGPNVVSGLSKASGPNELENQLVASSYRSASEVGVGNGIVAAGDSDLGLGDMQLIGTDATATELGFFGLDSASGLAVGSMAMYGGRLYLNCVDHTAGTNDVGLYALPSAAAAKVATTDVTLAATAETGGAATVADWRGKAAGTLDVRGGDTATWAATADAGYTFAGWYDASGNLVSSDATYSALATSSTALTARFTAIPATRSCP